MTEGLIGEIVRDKVYCSAPSSDRRYASDIGTGVHTDVQKKKSVEVASRQKNKIL